MSLGQPTETQQPSAPESHIVYPQSFGAPGWFGSYALKLDNIFNPDDDQLKNNIEDIIQLLEFCDKNNQYRSQ